MIFKYRIKELAAARGVKQVTKEVAELCGVSYPTASQWINLQFHDKRSMPADALKALSEWLNCSMIDLYSEPEDTLSHINNNNMITSKEDVIYEKNTGRVKAL